MAYADSAADKMGAAGPRPPLVTPRPDRRRRRGGETRPRDVLGRRGGDPWSEQLGATLRDSQGARKNGAAHDGSVGGAGPLVGVKRVQAPSGAATPQGGGVRPPVDWLFLRGFFDP